MRLIRIGTRGSKLSLVQTNLVLDALRNLVPDLEFEIVTIRTKGDVDARPLYTIDRKGIFEKEIDAAVLSGKIDFAVHSLKDIPSELPDGLAIACIPKRERPNDIFVNSRKLKLGEVPTGSVVGTSSLRRAVQIMRSRPDLVVKPIRGNVETRVKKMLRREFDALVLAEAGISRLGMRDIIAERLPTKEFTPAPGQGAMAIVGRKDDHDLLDLLIKIEDPKSRTEVTAERALLLRINAGCRFPLGALAAANASKLALYASVYSADGRERIEVERTTDSVADAERLGMRVADDLEKKGAVKLAKDWREAVKNWGDTGK